MRTLLPLTALVGLSMSLAAHAHAADNVDCKPGVSVRTADHTATCRIRRVRQTQAAPQRSTVQQVVAAPLKVVRDIPSECSACPSVMICYPG
jgi:hypothetical protein